MWRIFGLIAGVSIGAAVGLITQNSFVASLFTIGVYSVLAAISRIINQDY